MYNKTIAFTKSKLRGKYRYKDLFQIYPLESDNAPKSYHAKHFPIVLEYFYENEESKSNDKDSDDFLDKFSGRKNYADEILNILSVLTNHHFFTYNVDNRWAFLSPEKNISELDKVEKENYNNQKSKWTYGLFAYPDIQTDLIPTQKLSDNKYPSIDRISHSKYFWHDPIDSYKKEITFPDTINACLDNFFHLNEKTFKKVKSISSLICDGIEISDSKRTLAFLAYVSAIEALVDIEADDNEIEFSCKSCKSIKNSPYVCQQCSNPIWGISQKFYKHLEKFVAGGKKSSKKYRKIYNLRSKIVHQGRLFLSDYELSFKDMDKKEDELLMKIETLQVVRVCLVNWLRYPSKTNI